MPKAISLRDDYSAADLREQARQSSHAEQVRRLLALAAVADGKSRTEAAHIGAAQAQTLRDWVILFNEAGPDGLIDTPPTGRPPKLTPGQKQEMVELVEAGPEPTVDGVVRWRCVDLQATIRDRFGVSLSESSVGRILKELGFSHVSARPQHPKQDEQAIESFKKKSSLGK